MAGIAFYAARILLLTASLSQSSAEMEARAAMLSGLSEGSRLLTMSARPCGKGWGLPRDDHLGGFHVARNDGFASNIWSGLGRHPVTAVSDRPVPSQIVSQSQCPAGWPFAQDALGRADLDQFDFVLLNHHGDEPSAQGERLELIGREGETRLYRVAPSSEPPVGTAP